MCRRRAAAQAEYVGAEVCATCHRPIYDSFKKTDMGRSMSIVAGELPSVPAGHTITVWNEQLNRYYDVQSTPTGIYQSEYQKARGRFRDIPQYSKAGICRSVPEGMAPPTW